VVVARNPSEPTQRAMTKTARVYKIETLIRNRGHVSFRALLDELEVSPATLKRDLDYLKDRLGAPIQYDRLSQRLQVRGGLPRRETRTAGSVVQRARAVQPADGASAAQ
jgi:hypothetical protein